MMWIERILLNQQQDWLLQRLKFDELLRLKEFLTRVASNSFAGFFLPALNQRSSGGLGSFLHSHVQASSIRSTAVTTTSNQPGATASHGDRLVILGDGNVKGNSIF
jgi:hypothetical protein